MKNFLIQYMNGLPDLAIWSIYAKTRLSHAIFKVEEVIVSACVAKQANVMFSQASVCSTLGGVGGQHQRSTTSTPVQGQMSTTSPSPARVTGQPPPDRTTTLPPLDRVKGQPPPLDRTTSPPPARVKGHHPPAPCAGRWYVSYWNAFLLWIIDLIFPL